jgi:O-antigen ligase
LRIRFLKDAVNVRAAIVAAAALGLLGGAIVARKPTDALIICICLAGMFGLALLGERAFPWAIVLVAVIPWYPFIAESAEPPIVKQKVLCTAIAAAPLAPWLWSLAFGERRTRPNRATLMLGILLGGLTILIYQSLGSVSALIDSKIVGFLFIGVTFLCARRFSSWGGWQTAATFGLLLLLVLGLDAYQRAPSHRVGYFVGYPITYGALVMGLLPLAMLAVYRRSRLLAGGLAALSAVLLILSESRSSWVAATVVVVLAVLVQARAGNLRALGAFSAVVIVLAVLVTGTGSLHHIVEQKLSAKVETTSSVTHREWSYGYALETIGHAPLFGAGEPGFSAEESANRTSIGAIDNGYLSITVDMGLIGLLAAAFPIGLALVAVGRCLWFGVAPPEELALAFGIIAMAVVTAFYDSFYWGQIDLLLGGMSGVLSLRMAAIGAGESARTLRRRRLRRRRRAVTPRGSWQTRPLG